MRVLADENVPGAVVRALRAAGHDVPWVREDAPGSSDREVLGRSASESRRLLTFDKGFGERVFLRRAAAWGVVLVRAESPGPEVLAEFVVRVLGSRTDWAGHFSVIETDRIRMTPLL